MSRTIRQTALSGLFGSKRFIVSVCAAIAMVLGAMSVGASIFVPHSAADSGPQAANAPIFTERGSNEASNTSTESNGHFIKQRTLAPDMMQPNPVTPTPANIALPKIKSSLSIEFGPVNINAGINLGGLQVKADNPLAPSVETPLILTDDPIETPTIEPPKPQEDTPKEDETPTESQPSDDGTMAPLSITSTLSSPESAGEPQP